MNEFKAMLREAFAGEEPTDLHPDRQQLEESLRRVESRERVLRWWMWSAVLLLTAIAAWSAWSFLAAKPDAPAKSLILFAVLFLWAFTGIGQLKVFLFQSQQNLSLLKELKRTHLSLLERAAHEASEERREP